MCIWVDRFICRIVTDYIYAHVYTTYNVSYALLSVTTFFQSPTSFRHELPPVTRRDLSSVTAAAASPIQGHAAITRHDLPSIVTEGMP